MGGIDEISATIAFTKPLPQHLGCGSTCYSKIRWAWLTNNPGVQQNVSLSGAEKVGCMRYSEPLKEILFNEEKDSDSV